MDGELVIANGRVLDGCGNPWFRGDLAIEGGHIVAVSQAGRLKGHRLFDIGGMFVAPGFVDIHTHSDLSILINRRAESVVRQGVTTEVIGNCGMSPAPVNSDRLQEMRQWWGQMAEAPEVTWAWRSFAEYLETLRDGGLAINLAALAGHGALRIASMGLAEREPTPGELDNMKALLAEAMECGAFGLSTGLVYPPGCFASTEEIVELCRVVSECGGLYTTHVRGERETVLQAVEEAIRIGHQAKVPLQISHNAPKYGAPCTAEDTLRLVENARRDGQDITVDNDVHTDLGPSLTDGLPQPIQQLPIDEIVARLGQRQVRRQIYADILADRWPAFGPVGLIKHGLWDRVTVYYAARSPGVVGMTIEEIAAQRGIDPFDAYCELIIDNGHDVLAIFDYVDEANIQTLLRHPATMICSDGQVLAPYGFLNDPPPYNPCSYGEFPGVLERYVRDNPVLTIQEAIRKMTSFPAQRLGLMDRGVIRPGCRADLVVFDLQRVRDRASELHTPRFPFRNYPHRYPEGIEYVMVNGTLVVDQGEHTGALPGEVLRHTPRPRVGAEHPPKALV